MDLQKYCSNCNLTGVYFLGGEQTKKCFRNPNILHSDVQQAIIHTGSETDRPDVVLSGGCLTVAINIILKNIIVCYISYLSPAECYQRKMQDGSFHQGQKQKGLDKMRSYPNTL